MNLSRGKKAKNKSMCHMCNRFSLLPIHLQHLIFYNHRLFWFVFFIFLTPHKSMWTTSCTFTHFFYFYFLPKAPSLTSPALNFPHLIWLYPLIIFIFKFGTCMFSLSNNREAKEGTFPMKLLYSHGLQSNYICIFYW